MQLADLKSYSKLNEEARWKKASFAMQSNDDDDDDGDEEVEGGSGNDGYYHDDVAVVEKKDLQLVITIAAMDHCHH